MFMQRFSVFFLIGTVLFILFHGVCGACVLPGTGGGWYTKGDVNVALNELNFGDNDASWSYAYRYENKGQGLYRISFDYKNILSSIPYEPDGEDFAFLDTFYASLYFVDTCCRFDLETCTFCYGIPLFDLKFDGPYNNHGLISASVMGEGWQHFEMVFRSHFQKVIPVFELFDHNHINDDSDVLIANVSISQVPLPSTLLFLGSGILVLIARRPRNTLASRE